MSDAPAPSTVESAEQFTKYLTYGAIAAGVVLVGFTMARGRSPQEAPAAPYRDPFAEPDVIYVPTSNETYYTTITNPTQTVVQTLPPPTNQTPIVVAPTPQNPTPPPVYVAPAPPVTQQPVYQTPVPNTPVPSTPAPVGAKGPQTGPNGGVKFYAYRNYTGRSSIDVRSDNKDSANTNANIYGSDAADNADIESFKIGPGMALIAYADRNYGGHMQVFTSDTASIPFALSQQGGQRRHTIGSYKVRRLDSPEIQGLLRQGTGGGPGASPLGVDPAAALVYTGVAPLAYVNKPHRRTNPIGIPSKVETKQPITLKRYEV